MGLNTEASKNLGAVKRELLEAALWPGDEATPDERRAWSGPSLYRSLCKDVIDRASEQIGNLADNSVDLERCVDPGLMIVNGLQAGLSKWDSATQTRLNFWMHDQEPIATVRTKGQPYMARDDIVAVATDYLDLPYRVPSLERLLVDLLIALELYAFADEMLRKPIRRWWLPVQSPLQQRHVISKYVRENLWFGLIFGGLAYLSLNFFSSIIGEKPANWIALIAFLLICWEISSSTLLLPLAWRHQRRSRLKTVAMINAMTGIYAQLGASGAVSARHIRDMASRAAEEGVVWPGPLFAILDDNIARVGRLQ